MFHLFEYGFDCLRYAGASDAVADAELAHCVPGEFPELLRRTPDAAQRLRAGAKFGLVKVDADGDDVIRSAAQAPRSRRPGLRLDDQLNGLVAPSGGRMRKLTQTLRPSFCLSRESVSGVKLR